MKQNKVLVVEESGPKTDFYSGIFVLAGYEVNSCEDLRDLIQLIASIFPDLIFWSRSAGGLGEIRGYLTDIHQMYAGEKRPKLVLATSVTDVPPSVGNLVDQIVHEPVHVTEFLDRIKELLKK